MRIIIINNMVSGVIFYIARRSVSIVLFLNSDNIRNVIEPIIFLSKMKNSSCHS